MELMSSELSNSMRSQGVVDSLSLFVALLCACIVIGHLIEENRWINESITAILVVSIIFFPLCVFDRIKLLIILELDRQYYCIAIISAIDLDFFWVAITGFMHWNNNLAVYEGEEFTPFWIQWRAFLYVYSTTYHIQCWVRFYFLSVFVSLLFGSWSFWKTLSWIYGHIPLFCYVFYISFEMVSSF